MENYPQLVTLIIFIPLIGMLINLFFGSRLGEPWPGIIGSAAALLSFGVAIILYAYLRGSGFEAAVVNPPFLDGWITIPSADTFIPWQMRVDTLSVTMMLVVTGVGSMIHIYAIGYMHGDPRFARFFTYLNLFLVFMLILVTGNNFLMMFVGWEGVGLCSFLLIGFWFDRARGVGWKNSLAARKAMIVNRIGDFGLIMGIFLIFWTFGTLDYYTPGEIANVELAESGGAHGEEAGVVVEEQAGVEETGVAAEAEHGEEGAAAGEANTESRSQTEGEGAAAAEGEHAEEGAVVAEGEGAAAAEEGDHGEEAATRPIYTNNDHIPTEQLGVFGQAERMIEEGHEVDFGPFSLPIDTVLVLITLFMLIGATGKSAQIPLFIWLPDAMAGPTPVSALIHAATMVTAGVYLMVRSNVFFYEAEFTSILVTLIGAGTALVAGFIAIGQWDIKRVLAYSTISQLGFMVAAVGVGAYSAAMFHLATHAFFKALLFLGSGSVIHGVEHGHHSAHARHRGGHGHHEEVPGSLDAAPHHDEGPGHQEDEFDPQDMRNMGGLRRRMPITFWTYVIGTLALAGIWPFAGFWSKDEILADSWIAATADGKAHGFIALFVLLAAAGFTAFYMWRQLELVFFGQPRTEAADHAHESTPLMTVPLIVLAVLSIFGGFFNTPSSAGVFTLFGLLENVFGEHEMTTFLEPSILHAHAATFQPLLALIALAVALGAIFLARSIYGMGRALTPAHADPLYERGETRTVWNLAHARLYWDETYYRLFENPFNRASKFLADTVDWDFWHDYFHNTVLVKGFNALADLIARPFDLGIIDGAVNGVGRLTRWAGGSLRRVQTGYVRTYAVTLLLGVVLVLLILLWPALTNAGG